MCNRYYADDFYSKCGQLALFSMPQSGNVSEKNWKRKRSEFFSGANPFTFSMLKKKELVWELLVQKVSNFIQALFILKGKVKRPGAAL